ncbi:MAG: DUF885 domain-containing protein [Chloroflexi bacterium]|jgi:uncharacterized protein (DUF885 family)|nr:DUF885 domain-containing protein [Chloroflexota bacterium]
MTTGTHTTDGQATDGMDARASLDALADSFWESVLELSPTTATVYGDERYADRLEDPGPEGRARLRDLMAGTLAAVGSIDPDALDTERRITRDMLRVVAELAIEQQDQRIDVLKVVDQMEGPQTLLPSLAAFQPADTPERLEKLVARLHAYGPFMAANTELLREGMARGLTAPRIVAERTVAQLERLLDLPAEEYPLVTAAAVARDVDREAILAAVRDVVRPADAAYLAVLRDDYLPHARTEPGLWSAPDGEALYRTQVRAWTTLDLDPEDVHRIGLDELASIEEERRVIARAAGFGDDTVAYRASILSDPANIPASADALVARATDDIARAMDAAPRVFGRLPRAGVVVRPVEPYKEKDAPFAYYFPPTVDGSRPGIYYANTYDLPSRAYYKLASTTYHEAAPGHHFQITLEMEHPELPAFRRLGSRMVGGAYVEGWGLYSERLADELGLYRDEAERFGMLDAQAWRAARLVVDTGVHALRWERQRSIDFLRSAALGPTDALIETDRYIAWPGQALTYKTGQREIERLRRELTARDGAAFDLRRFHDAVLGHGSLPLATLAAELPRWLAPEA